jgi:outer membrane protein assembly factor BamD (BamD/ComL family)
MPHFSLNRFYVLLLWGLCVVAQTGFTQVSKGFTALGEYDFFLAKKCFTNALKKDPVQANFGLAKVHFDRLNHFHSYDSAYKRINLACIAYAELTEKKRAKLQENSIDEKALHLLADSIFIGAYLAALNGKQPEALSRYIDHFPDSPLRPEAISMRDSAAFSDALLLNTSKGFEEFIQRYPNSRLIDKAYKKLDLSRFDETVFVGTLEAFNAFLDSYPQSEFAGSMQDLVYTKVVKRGTEAELYAFVKQYPNNRNVSNAWNRLYHLFTNDQRAESVDAFKSKYPEFPYKERIREDSALLRTRLFPVVQNERWGYCDSTGNVRISYQFDDAEYFSENLAVIELGGKKGYINKAGFIMVMPQFKEADPFVNGRAIVETDSAAGIITAIGDWLVSPQYYSISGPFDTFYRAEQNEKYALLDADGKQVTPFQFDELEPFSEGLAAVAVDGKAGFIDATGTLVIPLQFEEAGDFKNGIARVLAEGKYGLLKKDGSWLIPAKYNDIRSVAGDVFLASDDKKCSYFNTQGKLLLRSADYCTEGAEIAKGFYEGLARASRNGKTGFIDTKGNWVIQASVDQATYFSEGLAAYRKKNKWGFMNKSGKAVIQPQFEAVSAFQNSHARAKLKGKWGIIGKDGKFIIPAIYDQILEDHSFFIVENNGKKGLLNKELGLEIPCEFDDLDFAPEKSIIELESDGGYKLFSLSEKKMIWIEAAIVNQ